MKEQDLGNTRWAAPTKTDQIKGTIESGFLFFQLRGSFCQLPGLNRMSPGKARILSLKKSSWSPHYLLGTYMYGGQRLESCFHFFLEDKKMVLSCLIRGT